MLRLLALAISLAAGPAPSGDASERAPSPTDAGDEAPPPDEDILGPDDGDILGSDSELAPDGDGDITLDPGDDVEGDAPALVPAGSVNDRPPPPPGRCSEVDEATDPLGPVDVALDAVRSVGFRVDNRHREQSLLGTACSAILDGPEHGLLHYQLDRLANDGFVVVLVPLGSHKIEVFARPTRGAGDRGVIFRGVDKVSIDGRYLRADSPERLTRLIGLDRNHLDPRVVGLQLGKLGYRAEFFPVAKGEVVIQVRPARSIRRVRVHGHVPLSRRDVQRKLSFRARPGALAFGDCVSPKTLRKRDKKGPPPSICSPDDLACRAWVDEETKGLNRFLYDQGYLKGTSSLALVCGRDKGEADLHVLLTKGKGYKVKRGYPKVSGNVPDDDHPWIRRTFRPRIPATPFRAPVTRESIEEAKERTERKYAEPRDSLIRSGATVDLQYLYPEVRVETSYEDMDLDATRIPDEPRLPLTVKIDVGRGVKTSFISLPAELQSDDCKFQRAKERRDVQPLRFSDKRLRQQLQLFKRRESPSADKAQEEAANLRAYYLSKGYPLAHVSGCLIEFGVGSDSATQLANSHRQLTFLVDEGPKVRIRSYDVQTEADVPPIVADRIRKGFSRAQKLKKGTYFTETGLESDLTELLKQYQENGYLCASANVEVAFWEEGFRRKGEHAEIRVSDLRNPSGAPRWAEDSLNDAGLATLRGRDRARLYVRVHIDHGPRVFTSPKPEEVRYLETPIPNSRDVSDLPYATTGKWSASWMLRDSPLRRPDDPTPGAVAVAPGLERAAEEKILANYQNRGHPIADAKVRWVYKNPRTGEEHRVPLAKNLTDDSVGLCSTSQSQAEVDTELSVYEGRAGVFGETLIRGNFKTRTWVLRRELDYKQGEDYSRAAVNKSQSDIDGTGTAESVEFEAQPVGCELDSTSERCVVHQVVDFREAKDIAMDVSGGVGLATLDPLYVFLNPSFPNLWGTGWDLDLLGHFGFDLTDRLAGVFQRECATQQCFERSARADLVRPRFLASPLTLKITGQIQQRVTPARGSVLSILGTLGFSWKLSKRWQTYFGYLIQAANISKDVVKPSTTPDIIVINRRDAVVTDLTGALQAGFTYTNIEDNPFNPEDGFIASVDVMFASPIFGGRDWWVRTDLSWQHFIPIPRTQNRLAVRYALNYGHAAPLRGLPFADTTSVPEVWRYFGGGTVDRGLRGIRPEEMLVDLETIDQAAGTQRIRYTPIGGHIRALGTLALQVVSVRDFLGGKLAHALFYDFGILTQRWAYVQVPRDLRHTVGLNFIKWDIRLVTVSLGWAVLVPNAIAPGNVRANDPRYGRFVFDVGVTF